MMVTALSAAGWAFAILGGWLIYTALTMETVLPASAAATEYFPAGMDGVVNLQLLQAQEMTLLLGIGAVIVGAVFLTGACLVSAFGKLPSSNPD
ncbi:MAG TPA: hypothetical protein VNH53_03885 [Sphingomicrobium sp.]|jgi:hypothetical protein|nr:hypothetical protein [Sphingomicrobium sp.]